MGANEKHAATYHVRKYAIRGYLIRVHDDKGNELLSVLSDGTVQGEIEHASQAAKVFMSELRGLTAKIRAEAKAEALREAASEIYRLDGDDAEMYNEDLNATPVTVWLLTRANQYKEQS